MYILNLLIKNQTEFKQWRSNISLTNNNENQVRKIILGL